MPVTWFQSQQAAETPIAPLSSQQAAIRYEPSVQGFVTELGGYTIPELEHFIKERWGSKFSVAKVWKAMDAISDKGLHSYLQHHWVILKLVPSEGQNGSSMAAKGIVSGNTELPDSTISGGPQSQSSPGGKEPQSIPGPIAVEDCSEAKEAANSDMLPKFSSAEAISKRQKTSTHDKGQSSSSALIDASQKPQRDLASTSPGPQKNEEADEEQQRDVKMSTEQQLSIEQTKQLQPRIDDGLNLADRGSPWFLRIDRFNEADKWFACATFENAMQSEQARNKHFRPTSEVTFEGKLGMLLLPLGCIVPSMAELAKIPYSVFAKGNHCQWHARVLTVLIASLSFFLTPCDQEDINYAKVSRILIDGKEQQRYAAESCKRDLQQGGEGEAGRPDSSYFRSFPEASYLKPAIQDLKTFAGQHDDQGFQAAARKPFPDLHLIYASMLPEAS